jgi:cytochrome c-type biogenesis protein CcmH
VTGAGRRFALALGPAFALVCALAFAWTGPAFGEDVPEPEGPVGATVALGPADDARAIQIGKKLRCVVCQGMSIADSPATTARSMMQRVREMVKEGKAEAEIQEYFVERYGEWVLLEPRAHGANWLVWLGPLAVVAVGAWLVARVLRRPAPARPSPSGAEPPPAPAAPSHDPYLAAVRKEMEK